MTTDILRQGRFRVERPLGAGAMGTVVLARDTVLDRRVAIKVLVGHLAADDAFRRRFLREARLAAQLCHPNIVQVFDAGPSDDGDPFLVMEYVEGETVADRLGRGQRFSTDEVVALAQDLAAGLAQAHALGIVHRDVKPHNVLLTGDGLAKLTDFGIARALEDRGLTEIGTVLGTAPYMAPEQAAGLPVGTAADIFALGAVLRHATAGPLPPALRSLVDEAAAPDPSVRPTAAEFGARLRAPDDAPTVVIPPAPTQVVPPAPTRIMPPAATPIPAPFAAERRAWTGIGWKRPALVALAVLLLLLVFLPRGGDGDRNGTPASGVQPVPTAPDAAGSARNLAGWLREAAD